MPAPRFAPTDILLEWQEVVDVNSLDTGIIYLLTRRAHILIGALNDKRRIDLLEYTTNQLQGVASASDALVIEMLKGEIKPVKAVFEDVTVQLKDLISEAVIETFKGADGSLKWREVILAYLQKMIFSLKSSFAQSGINGSCAVVAMPEFANNYEELTKSPVTLIVARVVDDVEKGKEFLAQYIQEVKWAVGRLIDLGQSWVNLLQNKEKVGSYLDPDQPGYHERTIVVWNETVRYLPQVDKSWALIVPLCPHELKNERSHWVPAEKLDVYDIEENLVDKVVKGAWYRTALQSRKPRPIPQSGSLMPWETLITHIPLDIGPHNANIDIVCVWLDGQEIKVSHASATYLDAVRTYGWVQLEIKNLDTKSIPYKDIHFRIRCYETDDATHKRYDLRQALEQSSKRWSTPVEHILQQQSAMGDKDLEYTSDVLMDIANIDRFFKDGHKGMVISELEKDGSIRDFHELLRFSDGDVVSDLLDIYDSDNSCHKIFIRSLQRACSVGREKRVIFICHHDISLEELRAIVKDKKVTDIFSVPWENYTATVPSDDIIDFCKTYELPVTLTYLKKNTKKKNKYEIAKGAKREKAT